MAKITSTVKVTGEGDDDIHLPGVGNMQNTFCGYVDVSYDELDAEDNPPDCSLCLSMIKKARNMRLYDGSMP